MTNIKTKGKNLTDVMQEICHGFGKDTFTSYEIYSAIMDLPKRNGRRRHYTLTYSEVKQRLARADYVEKLNEEFNGRQKVALYRNR